MKPIDIRQTLNLVHPDDINLPEAEQTTWTVRPLSFVERNWVESQGMRMIGVTDRPEDMKFDLRAGEVKRWRIKMGLTKVENFAGWETERSPLVGQVVTDGFLSTVPDHVLNWLNAQILGLTSVSAGDAGKS